MTKEVRNGPHASVPRAMAVATALLTVSFTACDDDGDGPASARPAAADAADVGPRPDAGDTALGDIAIEAAPAETADVSPEGGMIGNNRPERRMFSPDLLARLRTPPGFRVGVFASDLGNPRMLAVDVRDGSVYVTLRDQGQVVRLRDTNGDGDASDSGERTTIASAMTNPMLMGVHGITLHDGRLYLATVKRVFSATIADGQLGALTELITDLPDGGQHPNRTLAVGPDGRLYVTVGSTCNACGETNPEHATVLRVGLDGATVTNPANPQHPMLARNPMAMMSPRVFASGLRNVLGFAWHPTTGELWGSEHGSDGLGNDVPPDEIVRITGGKSYGWPFCYADRQVDPVIENPSMMMSKQMYCPTTEPNVTGYPAHSAPIGFVFYTAGQFPSAYRNHAFAALRGSWNREIPTGYKVVRVHFENGMPANVPGTSSPIEDFLSGFLIEDGRAHFGRIAGLAVDATGALLVAEDTNGVVYRVSYASGPGADGGTDGGVDAGADAPGG